MKPGRSAAVVRSISIFGCVCIVSAALAMLGAEAAATERAAADSLSRVLVRPADIAGAIMFGTGLALIITDFTLNERGWIDRRHKNLWIGMVLCVVTGASTLRAGGTDAQEQAAAARPAHQRQPSRLSPCLFVPDPRHPSIGVGVRLRY